jgi:hypothetical protein
MRLPSLRARRVVTGLAGCTMLAVAGLGHTPVLDVAFATTADHTLTVPTAPGSVSAGWEGTIPQGASVLLVGDPAHVCDTADPTKGDRETLQINVPAGLDPALDVTAVFSIDWTPNSGNGGVEDEKLVVLDSAGKMIGESDTGGQTYESTTITKVRPGTYTIIACPFQNPVDMPYTGKIEIVVSRPVPSVAKNVVAPTYKQHTAPSALAKDSGEPSLGVDWKTGSTMFQANQNTYKVAFDDAAGTSTWTDVTGNTTGQITLDPILWTDSRNGRTFVSQLLLACSAAEFTNDDGATWIPSQGCGEGTGIDHQSVGGGPFPPNLAPASAVYPSAVYYCTNGAAATTCGRSDNGGVTFTTVAPAFTEECGVLHGHIRVAPDDGTVYIPATSCHGKQGVSISHDGGTTWHVSYIPDSIAGQSDPSVSAGADGTVYFGYSDGSGKPKVAVSTDHGDTWLPSVDVGEAAGVHASEFAEMIAGDGDRAAFAFLGSTTDGDFQDAGYGVTGDRYSGGAWHMYVATTYDRGASWTTVDATPTDPVQRGCMWNHGGGSNCRNLLDFNDITTDAIGRVMVGFADGCTSYVTPCSTSTATGDNKREAHGAIIRQLSGKGLFAEFDGTLPDSNGVPAKGGSGGGAGGGSGSGSGSGGGSAGGGGGTIPTTGLPAALPMAGALLLLLAVLPLRRRRRATE